MGPFQVTKVMGKENLAEIVEVRRSPVMKKLFVRLRDGFRLESLSIPNGQELVAVDTNKRWRLISFHNYDNGFLVHQGSWRERNDALH